MQNHSSFFIGGTMCEKSFKERVKEAAIANASLYEINLIGYEYLVCSSAFANGYHIIKADKGNYLHLLGVHTTLSAEQFFERCKSGTLTENDFDFIKPNQDEKSVKGSVRKKIQVLPQMVRMFECQLLAEDDFKKNHVECAFATSDNKFTLGFASSGRPKSLLKGNELDKSKYRDVDLVFRKVRSSGQLYVDLYYGKREDIVKYQEQIKGLLAECFFE